MDAPPLLLAGLRVLDLSRVLAGPFLTMQLADLGAEVWKVERPGTGDDTRGWGPPFAGGESAYFLALNRGKRSVTLDLKRPEGAELCERLAMRADVVVENFGRAHRGRLGVDLERWRAARPRLVTCSVTGFAAEDEANADRPGYDALIQAEAGLMSVTGPADGPPTKVGVALSDVIAGQYALSGVLAALYARERDGRGRHVEVSLFDATVAALVNQAQAALVSGERPGRLGNAHPHIVPYQDFATADGYVMVAAGNDAQFERLARDVLGRGDLAVDPRFATNAGRVRHRDVLLAELEPLFRARPTAHWSAACRAAGVPAGPIRSVDEVLAEPGLAARGMLRAFGHPTAGELALVGSPLAVDGARAGAVLPPPRLGEHTDAVLREELALADAELAALRTRGIV